MDLKKGEIQQIICVPIQVRVQIYYISQSEQLQIPHHLLEIIPGESQYYNLFFNGWMNRPAVRRYLELGSVLSLSVVFEMGHFLLDKTFSAEH